TKRTPRRLRASNGRTQRVDCTHVETCSGARQHL
ncbi:hypothetical protein TGPRC2_229470B, partial [Toxoplasma gondii TgCatPRC2]